MKVEGERIIFRLKSKTILKRKPRLRLCSNHFKDSGPTVKRLWTGGQAFRDGKGWYRGHP